MNNTEQSWFKNWFDSSYYHILYKHRNYEEASNFLENLVSHLKIETDNTILDLACGAGRHSIFLANKGFKATGIDLSKNSIEQANATNTKNAEFYVKDMRSFELNNQYDFVFNLFTSFGYFEDESDNLKVLAQVKKHLKGKLVIDFFNAQRVVNELVKQDIKQIDGIDFHIKKQIEDKKIVKSISFIDKGEKYFFEEKVQLIALTDFTQMLSKVGLKIIEIFGDYQLQEFNVNESPRLILIAAAK